MQSVVSETSVATRFLLKVYSVNKLKQNNTETVHYQLNPFNLKNSKKRMTYGPF